MARSRQARWLEILNLRRQCVACDVWVPLKRLRRDVLVCTQTSIVVLLHCKQSAVCNAFAQGMAFWIRQKTLSA